MKMYFSLKVGNRKAITRLQKFTGKRKEEDQNQLKMVVCFVVEKKGGGTVEGHFFLRINNKNSDFLPTLGVLTDSRMFK